MGEQTKNTLILLAGCVIIEKNKILLLHRKKTDWYEIPGGKIEENERPEQTAIRELKEELCCDVEIIRKLDEKDFEHNGKKMRYIWFLSKLLSAPKIGEPDSYDHFAWMPFETSSKLSPNVQNFMKEVKEGRIKLE